MSELLEEMIEHMALTFNVDRERKELADLKQANKQKFEKKAALWDAISSKVKMTKLSDVGYEFQFEDGQAGIVEMYGPHETEEMRQADAETLARGVYADMLMSEGDMSDDK